jgi:hypothetical protein
MLLKLAGDITKSFLNGCQRKKLPKFQHDKGYTSVTKNP